MTRPLLSPAGGTNVYTEERYAVRVVLGATTTFTARGKDVTVTRPSATTLTFALPEAFTEITSFEAGRFAATGVAGLEWIITTNNIATDGTVTFTSINSSGTATAPATGDVAYIALYVSRDALNDRFTQ